MKRAHLAKILIASTVFFYSVAHANQPLKSDIHPYRGVTKKANEDRISQNDIQRFVRALAVVNHFYIKKEKTNQLFTFAIKGMMSQLDPHSSYLDEKEYKNLNEAVKGHFVGIGIEFTTAKGALKVVTPIDGSPAEKAGLKPNDLIIKVNDTLVQSTSIQEAIDKIKGKRGTAVNLTVIRKGVKKPINFSIIRDKITISSVKQKLITPSIGYVRIAFFQGPVSKQVQQAIVQLSAEAKKPLQGMILDLRNNPGGLLQQGAKVADIFLNKNKLARYNKIIVYTKGRNRQSDISIKDSSDKPGCNLPLIVLINNGSASAAEIVAGALQDYHRAIIMGTRSFGKGSVQSVIPITHKTAIKLTTALYYTPAGRVIQSNGITPDVIVPEFTIKLPQEDMTISEKNLSGHLTNNKKSTTKTNTHQTLNHLALKDYQLYRAIMMLKGLNAIKRTNF